MGVPNNEEVKPVSLLAALVASVIMDKVVDAEEVAKLRSEFYADGQISREECDAMFEINDAVSGNANDPTYAELFADVISDHVCADGEVTEEEANYLTEKLMADGGVDEVEKLALQKIRAKATKGIYGPFDTAMKSLGV